MIPDRLIELAAQIRATPDLNERRAKVVKLRNYALVMERHGEAAPDGVALDGPIVWLRTIAILIEREGP